MKQCFTFLLAAFAAIEAKKHKADSMSLNSNHVNVSLETDLLFDPKEVYYDVSLITSLRSFLDSLQNAITSKARLRTLPKDNYSLSDFLYELGGYIIRYSDENIKTGANALRSVVEDYYPAGTVYHKIFFDPRLKAFIKNTLNEMATADPKVIRAGLKAMYQGPTYEEVFVDLVEVLNCIYDKTDDSATLKKHAKKFEKFPSTKHKLESNIDKALNFIVFKRYEMLNFSMKSFVIQELSKVSEYVVVAFKNRSIDPEFLIRKRTNEKNLTLQDFLSIKELERISNDFSGSEREEFPVNANNSFERITKSSSEENEVEDKKVPERREIILNKAIEINVRKRSDDDIQ